MRFILVDKIVALRPGKDIRAIKIIKDDEDYFADHFPGFPVVPGVLLTEMMAQTAGKCLDAERRPRGKAMLVQISKASFREWVLPESTLVISAEILSNRDQYATARCTVENGKKAVCSAELFFSFLPMEKLANGYRDEVLESFIAEAKQNGAQDRDG